MQNYISISVNGRRWQEHIYIAFEIYKIKKICNRSGSNKNICVHHIDENKKNNEISNLEVICKTCHNIHHFTGKKYQLSEETRKRMSACRIGKKLSMKHILNLVKYKNIIQYSKDGKVVGKYKIIKLASESTGISASAIINNIMGDSKSAGGYIWKSLEN